jgi:predicted transcriptional regulator
MIKMAEYQQIIFSWHNGKSQRAIAKELGISRTTVQTHIQAYRARQISSSPKIKIPDAGIIDRTSYDSSKRRRSKLTEEMIAIIDSCLAKNEAKLASNRGKQRMKAIDIHAHLLAEGHVISYSSITNHLRQHHRKIKEAYIRQAPDAGHMTEFDWGEVKLSIEGKLKTYQLAVFTAAFSNHRFAVLFDRQDSSCFLESHVLYFSSVGGVMQELVYDNMRTAVAKFAIRNKDKEATHALLQLSIYYGFNFRFCNARKGNEKGHVERSVEFVRRKAFCIIDHFDTLKQANIHLSKTVTMLNLCPATGQKQSIQSRLDELERPLMRDLPVVPFDVGVLRNLRVDKYACIKVDTNRYSVPDNLVGSRLAVKIYPQVIKVYAADHRCLAQHERRRMSHHYYIKIDHFLNTLKHKPGALKGSTSLKQADELTRVLFVQHFKNDSKLFIELLIFLKQKQLTISDLKVAVQQCLQISPHQSVDKDKIIFFLTEQEGSDFLDNTNSQDLLSQQINQQCEQQLQSIQQLFS